MSNQRERSLDDLLSEVRQLKEKGKTILPSFTASLKDLSQLPEEFEGQFWASCLEAQIEEVKADYQKFLEKASKAELWGMSVALMADIVLKVGGMEPIPPPDSLRVGISMHPAGKIEPALMDGPTRHPDGVIVTYEQFVAIVQRVKDDLLKGTIVPSSEDEIPKLVYNLATKSP